MTKQVSNIECMMYGIDTKVPNDTPPARRSQSQDKVATADHLSWSHPAADQHCSVGLSAALHQLMLQ